MGEADWVETRAWNQIGIHIGTLEEQLHEKIQVMGVLIACFHYAIV